MKQEVGPVANVVRPILDQYRNAPIALMGCHSMGIERPSCELDILVVTEDKLRPVSVALGSQLVDITFEKERQVLDPTSAESAVGFAHARAIRDGSLVISTSSATHLAVLEVNCRKNAQSKLASAVKALGRADEALGRKSAHDADYWLLRASYDYAFALLYSKSIQPCPSHLLQQLKQPQTSTAKSFEAISKGTGLERASRVSCAARLEAISLIQDALRSRKPSESPSEPEWSVPRFEILKRKADFLAAAADHAEAYSFLGIETLVALNSLLPVETGDRAAGGEALPISAMADGKERMIGESLVLGLGIARQAKGIESGLRSLKEQVSGLARKI